TFVGIDYAKRFSYITVGDQDGEVLWQGPIPNEVGRLEHFFEPYPKLTVAIEACRGHEWLVDWLRDRKYKVHVGNVYAIKQIAQSRCKTDKIDSKILMELLAKGFLPTTYQPTKKERDYRELVRWRAKLVKSQSEYKLRVHALLDKENKGISMPFTAAGREALKQVDLIGPKQKILEESLEVIEFIEKQVHEQDLKIRKLAKSNPDVYRIKHIPGFDVLTAMIFVAEVGDVTRFRKAEQLAAFTGLVPRVYASGGKYNHGRITKAGPGLLRRMLVQSAWAAIRCCPALRSKFASICKRRGRKIAIIAIARMLAEIAYHVYLEKTPFDETRLGAGLVRVTE
ncbi:MAG: IS110 family transposase, partial [Cyanobacteria bacterium SZAS LIN-3]|nr:IS110 family transposase [Cyanobacteria bacterium SZAS LIN-3]